ncbi:hypothetical protein PMAYCL1PPCAC_07579, partial [Pristionchus mayeri]
PDENGRAVYGNILSAFRTDTIFIPGVGHNDVYGAKVLRKRILKFVSQELGPRATQPTPLFIVPTTPVEKETERMTILSSSAYTL